MKKCRQLHLWIGLFTSLLILVEAVTGLIMTEPWLIAGSKPPTGQRVHIEEITAGDTFAAGPQDRQRAQSGNFRNTGGGNSLMRTVRDLHAGRLGGKDISILLDIVAVGLIVITVTGMILSIKVLRAQKTRNRRN